MILNSNTNTRISENLSPYPPDGRVGFIVPVEGTSDQFLVGVERKFLVVRWCGQEGAPVSVVKEIGEVDRDVLTTRINDGKADPRGRVFAGQLNYQL